MAEPVPTDTPQPEAAKPAILRDQTFTVTEGIAYRACRTLAIWMNKLFFSSLVLLAVWLVVAAAQGQGSCVDSFAPDASGKGDVATPQCSVFLTPTSLYLGSAAVISFLLSIVFGMLGLVVGKQIVAATPAADEVGARRPPSP